MKGQAKKQKVTKFNIWMIYDFLEKNKLNKTQFCKLCKISVYVLNKILHNKNNIYMSSLFKVARTLGIQFYQIFAD